MNYSESTINEINKLYNTFLELEILQKGHKKIVLIQGLSLLGVDDKTVSEVLERGLPTAIFCNPQTNASIKLFFGQIAKLAEHTLIKEGEVLLSWANLGAEFSASDEVNARLSSLDDIISAIPDRYKYKHFTHGFPTIKPGKFNNNRES